MTNDLIARAKDYLQKTEDLPHLDKEWLGLTKNDVLIQEEVRRLYPIVPAMWDAFLMTPAARNLIEELVKRLEDYEERVTEINEAMGLFENTRQGLEIAYGIMTQNKEGEA